MLDWNVVITTQEHRYRHAREYLAGLGDIRDTDYYNVLVMRVDEPLSFLDALERELSVRPVSVPTFARVLPVAETFYFQSPQEFEERATLAARGWLPQLDGSRFHVRMHRRGFKGRLSSQDEERFLDRRLLEILSEQGQEAHLDFDSPDWILALDTVGQRAGMSLWSRQQLLQHPLLKLD